MPRYELTEGTANKFWEISLHGKAFTTRWGRIGTKGQQATKSFGSEAEARQGYDKLVMEKVRKGYFLVDDKVVVTPAEPAGERAGASAGDPGLEKAIRDNPDDAAAWSVYGDWLQAHGDPHGELVALDVAIAGGKKGLEKARAELFEANQEELLGDLMMALEAEAVTLEWRFGFIDAARLAITYDTDVEDDAAEITRKLLAAPAGRFLRKLTFGLASNDGENDYNEIVKALAAADPAPPLRELFLGDYEYPDETEISWTTLGDLSQLWAAYPLLRDLHLRGTNLKLGKIEAPQLRTFLLESGGTSSAALQSIAAAVWPKLEQLTVWTGSSQYNFDGTIDDLRPILEAKGLPSLKRLGIVNSELGDELARALPGSKILAKLEELDLSMGTMSDEGARAIADAAAAFRHLKDFDLSENTIEDQELLARIGTACPGLEAGSQRDTDEYDGEVHRYVSVGE